ncbi:hypothetical protein ACQPXB_21170 [Amycolatopsis sp. CA-161197]|uniref:hypothetical protein n=1 Tax=Amycolatopsis sp. CA-161197 TaxID=3239922 RepID=UPI003D941CB2
MTATTTHRAEPSTDTRKPERAVHFVGSLPEELHPDDRSAMQWVIDQANGAPLTALPCDREANWVVSWLYNLATCDALEPFRGGEATGYDDYPRYRVAPGKRLAPEDVSLRRASDTRAAMAARRTVQLEAELPPLQVSVPNPLDLAFFCFGPSASLLMHLDTFRRALVDDVDSIHQQHGDEVVFQLETPASLIALDKTPEVFSGLVIRFLVEQITRLITETPRDARWILHLCHGDLNHEPAVTPHDLTPAVRFIRALHHRLTRLGESMPQVHIPMCTGTSGPPPHTAFYRALSRLPADVRLIAGLVDELNPRDSRRALQLVENALGHPVTAVAAACGHGRRDVTHATANAALARELAQSSHRQFASHRRHEGDDR